METVVDLLYVSKTPSEDAKGTIEGIHVEAGNLRVKRLEALLAGIFPPLAREFIF